MPEIGGREYLNRWEQHPAAIGFKGLTLTLCAMPYAGYVKLTNNYE